MAKQKSEDTKKLLEQAKLDIVKVGKDTYNLNREITFITLEKFTNEAYMLEDASRNSKPDTIMENAKRSDKWVRDILQTFLVDFKQESINPLTPKEANVLAAQVFFSVRTGLPFLAIASESSTN